MWRVPAIGVLCMFASACSQFSQGVTETSTAFSGLTKRVETGVRGHYDNDWTFVKEHYDKFALSWDEALAPIPCSNLTNVNGHWVVKGKLIANGVDFSDSALMDPAADGAVSRKMSNHIGPGC